VICQQAALEQFRLVKTFTLNQLQGNSNIKALMVKQAEHVRTAGLHPLA